MTDQPLSPAAAAVLAAYHKEAVDYIESWGSFSHKRGMAAALRAAIAVTQQYQGNDCLSDEIWTCDADELLAIAAELDNTLRPSK